MSDPHHHDFGGVLLTNQACPACPIYAPAPSCPYCAGTGVVSLEQLGRWQAEMNRQLQA